MLEKLAEDFATDEACGAGEYYFHCLVRVISFEY